MKPREAVLGVTLALAVLAAPLPSDGQQPAKVYRIGYFAAGPAPVDQTPQHCPKKGDPQWQAWVKGLRERGYVQGQNLVIECRWTLWRDERSPALAAELASLRVDLLVAVGTAQVRAAKRATSAIPIVMVGVIDPVGRGLVASLAQPGDGVTGLTETAGWGITGKHLQLLKEAVPHVSRVAVLRYSGAPSDEILRREVEAAARKLDVTLAFYEVRDPEDFEGTFAAMIKARADALLVVPTPFIGIHARRIADLAAKNWLPSMYPFREAAEAGGLMAYGPNQSDIFRRLGIYVDKILNGAKPGDLPVEQPTKFELLVNLTTAEALGLTIPQSLLSQADEVIQ